MIRGFLKRRAEKKARKAEAEQQASQEMGDSIAKRCGDLTEKFNCGTSYILIPTNIKYLAHEVDQLQQKNKDEFWENVEKQLAPLRTEFAEKMGLGITSWSISYEEALERSVINLELNPIRQKIKPTPHAP